MRLTKQELDLLKELLNKAQKPVEDTVVIEVAQTTTYEVKIKLSELGLSADEFWELDEDAADSLLLKKLGQRQGEWTEEDSRTELLTYDTE